MSFNVSCDYTKITFSVLIVVEKIELKFLHIDLLRWIHLHKNNKQMRQWQKESSQLHLAVDLFNRKNGK